MDTRLFRIIIISLLVIIATLSVCLVRTNKPHVLKSMNEDIYWIGETVIKDPVIVLLPTTNHALKHLRMDIEVGREFEDTVIDTQRFVCSDSIAQYMSEPGWSLRPDVYLYIEDENNIGVGCIDHFYRLGYAGYLFNPDSLENKENDSCVYRNVFPSEHFEVYMLATRHVLMYSSNDELAGHPVVNSYRLAVKSRDL